jgi:hypothetical protein
MPVTETFDEACVKLSELLRRESQPAELLWLCREDITGRRRRIFIHPSPPSINRDLYRQRYEFGAQQGRGMRLEVHFFLDDRACCFVWVPRDEIDASQAWLSGDLRLSVPTQKPDYPITATQCGTLSEFVVRGALSRIRGESPIAQDFPFRSDLQTNSLKA